MVALPNGNGVPPAIFRSKEKAIAFYASRKADGWRIYQEFTEWSNGVIYWIPLENI
jgi:hypothetical protein